MPQLDILIFKYENLNFIISFFLFFFLNQYFVFPAIVRNVTLRRKLITRSLITQNETSFFLSLVKKYNVNLVDNFIFSVSIFDLRVLISQFVKKILSFFSSFFFIKQSNFVKLLKEFTGKLGLVIWLNNVNLLNQIK
jgi:hypothetical protein